MSCAAIAAVLLHVGSWHSQPGYHNRNPGIAVRTECGIVAGVYDNSVGKVTAYAGGMYDPPELPVFASLVAATGYQSETGWLITPVLLLGVKSPEIEGVRGARRMAA